MSNSYILELPDTDHVMEVIGERFDDALCFMTDFSVIYGGAVRDVLAGMPIEGDIDISVARCDFGKVTSAFGQSPKWRAVQAEDAKRLAARYGIPSGGLLSVDISARSEKPSGRILAMDTFESHRGMKAQVIVPSAEFEDPMMEALTFARDVDIACCGVVMLNDGRVFEVVPGAFEDCKNKVLRFNEGADLLHIEALEFRVNKLVARGWKSEIDIRSKIMQANRKKKREEASRRRKMGEMAKYAEIHSGSTATAMEVEGETIKFPWNFCYLADGIVNFERTIEGAPAVTIAVNPANFSIAKNTVEAIVRKYRGAVRVNLRGPERFDISGNDEMMLNDILKGLSGMGSPFFTYKAEAAGGSSDTTGYISSADTTSIKFSSSTAYIKMR
jgi:hypothetical protein